MEYLFKKLNAKTASEEVSNLRGFGLFWVPFDEMGFSFPNR